MFTKERILISMPISVSNHAESNPWTLGNNKKQTSVSYTHLDVYKRQLYYYVSKMIVYSIQSAYHYTWFTILLWLFLLLAVISRGLVKVFPQCCCMHIVSGVRQCEHLRISRASLFLSLIHIQMCIRDSYYLL